jgi:hypothetical protein
LIILKSGLAWAWLTQDWINLNQRRKKLFFSSLIQIDPVLGNSPIRNPSLVAIQGIL